MSDAPEDVTPVPTEKPCKVCGEKIPYEAGFCNQCKSYQDWRRFIGGAQVPLALFVALIAIISPTITAVNWLLHYHSKTSVIVIDADRNNVLLYLWNTGRNPSAVVSTRVLYSCAPLQDDDLLPMIPDNQLIKGNGQAYLELAVQDPKRKNVSPCKSQSARIQVTIQESNGCQSKHEKPLPSTFVGEVLNRLQMSGH